jgi:hypothetical protein
MTTPRFSAVDSEPASTARMANATTRTTKENSLELHTKTMSFFSLLTYTKESECIVHMSRMYE